MTCPACARECRPDARFCDGCGARLAAVPAAPARRPGSYTPRHLAEKILGSRAALEGERKQVTVLFADVKGSTELAQQVDPEEWHAILDRFFQVLTEGIHRFEGTVNQYTGDGVMALFGAPIAHEDHAQRACHAALRLRDALCRLGDELRLERGLDFAVRMGINSGEVVVGRIGDDLRMDYTAQGHTVNLAARMEQLAGANRICLSAQTARLVEGWFTLRSLGATAVKGVAEQIEVYELEGLGRLRSRFDVSRARGLSRFVGREREMAVLEAALERACAGTAQSVGIVAEAGTGKSRLAHEFVERCRARGLPVTVSHCVAHGREVPLLPVMETLRGVLGVEEHDGEETTRDKVTGRLMRLDPALGEHVPFLLDFLGVPDPDRPAPRLDSDARIARIVEVLARLGGLFERGRSVTPVRVYEDLHWIDEASEAVLNARWEHREPYGIVRVYTYRPYYRPPWEGTTDFERLELAPLAERSTDELLADLLGPAARDPSLLRLVRERSAGNPFFVEEIVRSLAEAGALEGVKGAYRLVRPVEGIAVPDSVQAVLAARIDRLGEREKVVLQAAGVIGKGFDAALVARVCGRGEREVAAALEVLGDAELVHQGETPEEGAWVFAHPLTQEVAYESQLRDARRERHRALARALAERVGSKPGEKAALVAQHWEAGDELLEAARWYQRAAEWVEVRNFPEGARQWRRLAALIDRLPESRERDDLSLDARGGLLRTGLRVGASDAERAELQAEITRLAKRVETDARTRVLHATIGASVPVLAGEGAGSMAELAEADALAHSPEVGDDLRVAVRAIRCLAHMYAGRIRDGLALTTDALSWLPADRRVGSNVFGTSPGILLRFLHAFFLRESGRLAEALAQLDEAARESEAAEEGELRCLVAVGRIDVDFVTRDAEAAARHAAEAAAAAEAVDSDLARGMAAAARAGAHLLRAEWREAEELLEASLATLHRTRASLADEPYRLLALADAAVGLGDVARAERRVREAIEAARQRGNALALTKAHVRQARVLIARGEAAALMEAEAVLDAASVAAAEIGCRLIEPAVAAERAALARRRGAEAEARRLLDEAGRLAAEMGLPAP